MITLSNLDLGIVLLAALVYARAHDNALSREVYGFFQRHVGEFSDEDNKLIEEFEVLLLPGHKRTPA